MQAKTIQLLVFILCFFLIETITELFALPMEGMSENKKTPLFNSQAAIEDKQREFEISEIASKEEDENWERGDTPYIAEEKENQEEVALTLDSIKTALEQDPKAARFVLKQDSIQNGILVPEQADPSKTGSVRSENIRAIKAFKKALQASYPEDYSKINFDDLFSIDPMKSLRKAPTLSAEKIREAFNRLNSLNQQLEQKESVNLIELEKSSKELSGIFEDDTAALSSLKEISTQTLLHQRNKKPKSEKANEWLTEQALKAFVLYYYSLEWVRDYLLEMKFHKKNLELDNEDHLATNLILCIKTASELFPTARGLVSIEKYVDQIEKMLANNLSYYGSSFHSYRSFKDEFSEDARYHFALLQKAQEVQQQHSYLSTLWKNASEKKLGTFAAWQSYALAKQEEARIITYQTEQSYWEKMKDEPPEYDNIRRKLMLGFDVFLTREFYETQENKNDFIKNYRARAEEAQKIGNQRLAALWTEIVDIAYGSKSQGNLDQVNDLFLAAWSLTKAMRPDQKTPILWKRAADYFQKNNGNREIHASSIANSAVKIAKQISTQIKKQTSYATSLKKKADQEHDLELSQLYKKGMVYFQEVTTHLIDAAMIEDVEEDMIRRKMDSLQTKINRIEETSYVVFSRQIEIVSKHWKNAKQVEESLRCTLPSPSKLEQPIFNEIAILLLKKIEIYQETIKGYFELVEHQARANWELENPHEVRMVGEQVMAENEKLDFYNRVLENTKPYLDLLGAEYHLRLQEIETFFKTLQEFIIKNFYDDLRSTYCHQGKAALLNAKKSIQEAINSCQDTREKLILISKEFQDVARLFAKAIEKEKCSSAVSKLYIQAAEHLNNAAAKRKENLLKERQPHDRLNAASDLLIPNQFHVASDFLVTAATMMEIGKQEEAKIKAQEAALMILDSRTHDPLHKERLLQLQKMASHPQLTTPYSFDYWKKISDWVEKHLQAKLEVSTVGRKKQREWYQRGQAVLRKLNEDEEKAFEFFMNALKEALAGDQERHDVWDRAAQGLDLMLQKHQEELQASNEKRELDQNIRQEKLEIEQLLIKLIKNTNELSSGIINCPVNSFVSVLKELDKRQDGYLLKILQNKATYQTSKELKNQLREARRYYQQLVQSSQQRNEAKIQLFLEATNFAIDSAEQWMIAAEEKRPRRFYNLKGSMPKAEEATKKAREFSAKAKEKASAAKKI